MVSLTEISKMLVKGTHIHESFKDLPEINIYKKEKEMSLGDAPLKTEGCLCCNGCTNTTFSLKQTNIGDYLLTCTICKEDGEHMVFNYANS